MPVPRRFRIPARMPTRSVVVQLDTELSASIAPPETFQRCFLDTADWRLYVAGCTLEADVTNGLVRVTLRDRRTEEVQAAWNQSTPPEFAADLPAAAAKAVGDRRLLPQVELGARLQRVAVLNDEHKTTARVLLERYLMDAGSPRRIVRAATILPVRGYDRSADRVAGVLQHAGLHPYDTPLLDLILRLQRRPAPGSDLGPGVQLKRQMSAAQAVAAVLGRLRRHVVSNEAGVRAQLDREFLHDYRVAIRRARSILRRTVGALPEDGAWDLAEELRWLAGLTSPVRDLDVHIEELQGDDREELKPLLDYLYEKHATAHQGLVEALDSDRYGRLLQAWEALEADESGPDAQTSAGRFADEHIAQAFRRVVKRGVAIDDNSPPAALHDLRKRAKELRYLLECFQTLYPEAERVAFIRELKALQDNLGEFQDCQVQAATLRDMAEDLIARGAPAATLMAMGGLAEQQESREARARAEFSRRFARFASRENRHRMSDLVSAERA
jgi:CHAD domain-containing protein